MQWYPFYPLDFERDAGHLQPLVELAYRRLIDWYMIHEGPPIDNDAALARITKLTVPDWLIIRLQLLQFFEIKRGHWRQSRCEEELRHQATLRKKAQLWQRSSRARKALKTNEPYNQMSGPCQGYKTGQDISKKEERGSQINGSVSLALTRPSRGTSDPAKRKEVWQQRVLSYLRSTLSADRVLEIEIAYAAGESWAKAEFDRADKAMRSA